MTSPYVSYSRGTLGLMEQIKAPTTHGGKAGWCPDCEQWFGNLANHVPYCSKRDHEAAQAREAAYITRAASHSTAVPRAAQRWQHAVTDLDVAAVMYAIEAMNVDLVINKVGHWVGWQSGRGIRLHWVVSEMIRTGLLRHVIERQNTHHLVPALVHLKDDARGSACRFTGEDMGPMRSRLVTDLALVDCLHCLEVVATGHPRGL